MDYSLEDTQNSAPGQPTAHEVSKLAGSSRRMDTQSVTKRSVIILNPLMPTTSPYFFVELLLGCMLESDADHR